MFVKAKSFCVWCRQMILLLKRLTRHQSTWEHQVYIYSFSFVVFYATCFFVANVADFHFHDSALNLFSYFVSITWPLVLNPVPSAQRRIFFFFFFAFFSLPSSSFFSSLLLQPVFLLAANQMMGQMTMMMMTKKVSWKSGSRSSSFHSLERKGKEKNLWKCS